MSIETFPNPIYGGNGDGPVYESIPLRHEIAVAVVPPRVTETHQASSVTISSHVT